MKKLLLILAAALLTLAAAATPTATQAASDLATRILPTLSKDIEFVEIPSEKDFYQLETVGGKLRISANNANSMAVALGDYLNDWCNVTVTWYQRDAVREPKTLPAIEVPVRRDALVKHRFFLNYCTFGYALPWWQWKDWERLIDWMALHGVTLALANTGQEAVWQQVWQEFGMTAEQTREYFVGPGYLAWHRMTNIDGWHGPLPQGWIDGQAALQKQIVERELSLGISPILSAFSGHVPVALKKIYPEANITKLSDWGKFQEKYNCWYLNPSDPLYDRIQKAFLAKQKELFGQDCHIYGLDLFNEIDPPSWDADYLYQAAKKTYEALVDSDPEAVWLQMGWLFYYDKHWTNELIEAYLKPVPKGRLIMIDYYCEMAEVYRRTDSFYGQDFIWSYLGNFGGNTMISGDFRDISTKLDRAYKEAGSGFVGVGCTLEGLGVDPQVFEYVLGRAWEKKGSDEQWIARLADRHAGFEDENYRACWHTMYDKCHKQISGKRGMIISSRPNLKGTNNWRNRGVTYDNHDLLKAWGQLVASKPSKDPSYKFDCANIARQCLENHFAALNQRALMCYNSGYTTLLDKTCDRMLTILDDLDAICGTDSYFLLGKWIEDARAWGTTPEEKDYYEQDARMLITVWGNRGAGLNDYAQRSYSGLIKSFYKPRWERFLGLLQTAARSGKKVDEKAFAEWSKDFEWDWALNDKTVFPSEPKGNPVSMSKALYKKYCKEIADAPGIVETMAHGANTK